VMRMVRGYEAMKRVLAELKDEGYEQEVPLQVLARKVAEVTGIGDRTAIKRFVKSMHFLGLVAPGAPNMLRITGSGYHEAERDLS